MEIIKTGLAKHECDTPRLDPNWMSISKGPTYKNGALVKCECGEYYVVTTSGSDNEWLTWRRVGGLRLRRKLRSISKTNE